MYKNVEKKHTTRTQATQKYERHKSKCSTALCSGKGEGGKFERGGRSFASALHLCHGNGLRRDVRCVFFGRLLPLPLGCGARDSFGLPFWLRCLRAELQRGLRSRLRGSDGFFFGCFRYNLRCGDPVYNLRLGLRGRLILALRFCLWLAGVARLHVQNQSHIGKACHVQQVGQMGRRVRMIDPPRISSWAKTLTMTSHATPSRLWFEVVVTCAVSVVSVIVASA